VVATIKIGVLTSLVGNDVIVAISPPTRKYGKMDECDIKWYSQCSWVFSKI
jgi:hypothetical protein